MTDQAADPKTERIRKIANDCFKKGTEAMAKENWDYAVEMFGQAGQLCPDNVLYRQTLRGVQYRKYKNNKSGAKLSFLSLNGIRSRIKKAKAAKEWNDVDKAAEEGLALNPWDAQFNFDLGEACKHRNFDETAIFAYSKAVETEPENREFIIGLADMQERRGDYAAAISGWERIMRLEPLNGEARSKITGLRATSVIDRGGYEKAENTNEVRLGYEESVSGTKKEADGPGMSTEADLQRAIRKEPQNKDNYLKLADFLRREGRAAESIAAFEKALEVSSNDPSIREQMEDLQLEQLRKQRHVLREKAAKAPSDAAAQEKLSTLSAELVAMEVDVFSRRVERYPADLKLKFELAERYFATNRHSLAIPLYQQAAKDTRSEATVLVKLGKCFLKEKRNDLARRQFQRATELLNFNDNPDQFKECHYFLARLLEEAKDLVKAEASYLEVLAVDYEFRDVRARLEKIQEAQA